MTIPEDQTIGTPAPEAASHIPPPPPLYTTIQRARRPASVIVIAILFFLSALAELTGFFQPLLHPMILTWIDWADSVVFFLVLTLAGIGLLRWHPAARTGAIYALIARFVTVIPLTIFQSIEQRPVVPMPQFILVGVYTFMFVLMAVYFTVMIYFLTRPNVISAFKQARREEFANDYP